MYNIYYQLCVIVTWEKAHKTLLYYVRLQAAAVGVCVVLYTERGREQKGKKKKRLRVYTCFYTYIYYKLYYITFTQC